MSIDIIPARLPSLEGYKAALATALIDDWDAAAAAVAAKYPDPVLATDVPKGVIVATGDKYIQIPLWPYAVIVGNNLRMEQAGQSERYGQWLGAIEVFAFVQETNRELRPIATLMDRYAAILWLIVINHDRLVGSLLDLDSFAIETSEPEGNNANVRAVTLSYDIRWRT